MSYFVKIILIVGLIGLLFGSLTYFAGQTGITTQLSHLSAAFGFIAGNVHNLNEIFPVSDLLLAVSAAFAVEGLILLYKFGRFIIKLFK